MRLTRFSDYSLRVLIYLGLEPDRQVTIRSVSEAYGISRNHLMKVVSQLTRLGYLNAQRGPGGGIRLARPPSEINLAGVIRDTEEDLSMVECFDPSGGCVIAPHCKLQQIIELALNAFMNTLHDYTLEDLLRPKAELARLLDEQAKLARSA